MSLNSQGFQKYKSSKLKLRKKVRLSMEIEDIFVFSTLTARIFGTTGSSVTLCTSFESSDQCQSGPRSLRQ